jgi:arylsulfatase A-like enzyme
MINLLDIFATICELTDGKIPQSKDIAPDSYSFLPSLLQSSNQHPRETMVTADAHGMQAIRVGDWKYIDDTPPENLPENRLNQIKTFKPQLYNLSDDPGEKINLYDENPEKVNELRRELDRIREADSTR